MKQNAVNSYRCPACRAALSLAGTEGDKGNITRGKLTCASGHEFSVDNGIPDLTWPKILAQTDEETRRVYDKLADEYDKFASIPFQTFKVQELDVRKDMVDRLALQPHNVVLEVGCGDGRGAAEIASRLSDKGQFFLQELSPSFLSKAIKRLNGVSPQTEFAVANASYLSFPDNYFDAAHHFGGINTFSEIGRCLKELARVVKPGGRVVVGDEGIGPWLRRTQFGKIMINSNPLIGYQLPLDQLPVEARNVKVEWIMMGAFFLIEFTVGDGEPNPNYHIPIPSERGGTHWSRFHGQLEGISDATKKLAQEARAKSGKSMHDWLDDTVREAAEKQLGQK